MNTFTEFEAAFTALSEPDEKASLALEFMKNVLSQKDAPKMKEFWDAKHLCMDAFKEKMNPVKRKVLWEQYIELTTEAKQLKVFLDEQSQFAVEQIELAITALQAEIGNMSIESSSDLEASQHVQRLFPQFDALNKQHKELTLLNAFSVRLNALRKEVIKTDMRIKNKNGLLAQITACSDEVFPKRRELIAAVSDTLLLAVETFAAGRMKEDRPPFHLKDDIRQLQALAKQMPISSPVFKKTRTILSDCWEQLKSRSQEFAEKMAVQAEEQKAIIEELRPKIEAFAENPSSIKDGNQLMAELKDAKLARKIHKELSDLLTKGIGAIKSAKKAQEEKQEAARQEKLEKLFENLEGSSNLSKEELDQLEKTVDETLLSLAPTTLDRLRVEYHLLALKVEMALQADNNQHKELVRKQLRDKLQSYRKQAGSSVLDFEKGLVLSELIEKGKTLLARMDND